MKEKRLSEVNRTIRWQDLELSYIIPVYFGNNNFDSLINLLKKYSSFNNELLKKVEFIIVDDGSPFEIIIPENINLNYQLIRIEDDIPWNNGGARNLGVVYCHCSKIIITDCDHFFPENLMLDMLKCGIPKNKLYKFKRTQDGKRINSHTNTFFTSKQVFFASLGYDEEFSGNYGLEDVYFVNFQKKIGNKIRYFTRFKTINSNSHITDDNHSLIRDLSYNQKIYENKMQILRNQRPFSSHSRLFLNFEYKKVKENWI